jgi:hypothetical protein
MSSFSQSIKNLNTVVDATNLDAIARSSAAALAPGDKLKFICDNKELLFKAIDVAKIFTGSKGDAVLDALKKVIESICQQPS